MSTYSAIINDIQLWDAASTATRVAIGREIADKLGEDYMYVGCKTHKVGGQVHEMMAIEHAPTMLVFLIIPGGTFQMGSSEAELAVCEARKWKGDLPETPVQEVKLRAFLLSEFTVTEKAYRAMSEPSDKPWEMGEYHPKEAVSRAQARIWCRHFRMRLPTEAEWEYACRAGTHTVFYWGDEPDHSHVWMKENYGNPDADEYINHSSREHLNKVNAFGLIDMLGNQSEWVEDDSYKYAWHDPNDGPYVSDDPKTDGILRGGCFMYNWNLNRCATRIKCSDYGDTGIGFRPAKDIPALDGKVEDDPSAIKKSERVNPSPSRASEAAASKKPWWKVW